MLKLGAVVGDASVAGKGTRAYTVVLKPGTTYAVLNTSDDNPGKWPLTSFTVGPETSTAVRPQADATVKMVEYAFEGNATLPQKGIVRFENRGRQPHFAVAFPLRAGADTKAAEKAIRANDENRFMKFAGGEPDEPQGLVTAGAVNDVEVSFPKKGKYLLVCFFSLSEKAKGHNEKGMYRTVTVR